MFAPQVYTRDDLLHQGLTARQITSSVRAGRLIRLRRNRYGRLDLDDTIAVAVRIGGRLTCLSLLQILGVFVLRVSAVHTQVPANSSRLGAPTSGGVRVHWADEPEHDLLHVTSLRAAVIHSMRCQSPRTAVATLDSLVHHGLVTMTQLEAMFLELPARFRTLLRLVDPSAESGPETFVRLILRALGVSYETQVLIVGVGRVDFVVDGWLVVECDSRTFHEGWTKQKQDRERDLAAARLGYVTVRPLAADILHRPDTIADALRDVIDVLGPKFTSRRRSQLRRTTPEQGRRKTSGRRDGSRPEL